MAYNKRTWLGRQGTGLNKFSIGGASPVTIVNQPDSVTQVGDALSAGNLNDLEDRIEDAFDDVDTELATKADEQDVTNLNNAINQLDHRLENLEQSKGDYIVSAYKDGSTTPSGKGKWCVVEGVEGVSRVENQLVDPANLRTREAYGVTITANADGSITVSGTANASTNLDFTLNNFGTIGHSYVVCGGKSNGNIAINDGTHIVTDSGAGAVLLNSTGTVKLQFPITNGVTYNVTITPCVTDLNIYFGGTIPSDADTIAKIQTNYPHLLLPSDYGTRIVDWTGNGVRAEGVNIWDEEWEEGVLSSDGSVVTSGFSNRRTTSFIRIDPSTAYFQTSPVGAYGGRIAFYDQNKNFVYYDNNGIPSTGLYTSPQGAYYMRVTVGANYGTTYGHDIQFCLYSLPSDIRTVYHPYQSTTLSFPSATLKSAGSVRDTLELNVEVDGVAKKRATQRIGEKLITDLSFTKASGIFYALLPDAMPVADSNVVANILCEKFIRTSRNGMTQKGQFSISSSGSTVYINLYWDDISIPDFLTAMAGISFYYELATYVETLSDPILDNTLLTESGGRLSTVQTGTVVDGIADLGFITL